jgi:hypothetical protein
VAPGGPACTKATLHKLRLSFFTALTELVFRSVKQRILVCSSQAKHHPRHSQLDICFAKPFILHVVLCGTACERLDAFGNFSPDQARYQKPALFTSCSIISCGTLFSQIFGQNYVAQMLYFLYQICCTLKQFAIAPVRFFTILQYRYSAALQMPSVVILTDVCMRLA